MEIKWIKIGDDLINPSYIALIQREGEDVIVHLALPGPQQGHVVKRCSVAAWENAVADRST
jgi:hypothetical protein